MPATRPKRPWRLGPCLWPASCSEGKKGTAEVNKRRPRDARHRPARLHRSAGPPRTFSTTWHWAHCTREHGQREVVRREPRRRRTGNNVRHKRGRASRDDEHTLPSRISIPLSFVRTLVLKIFAPFSDDILKLCLVNVCVYLIQVQSENRVLGRGRGATLFNAASASLQCLSAALSYPRTGRMSAPSWKNDEMTALTGRRGYKQGERAGTRGFARE